MTFLQVGAIKLETKIIKFQYWAFGLLLFNCLYATIIFMSLRELSDLPLRFCPISLMYIASIGAAFLALKDRTPELLYPIVVMNIPIIVLTSGIWMLYASNTLYCGTRLFFDIASANVSDTGEEAIYQRMLAGFFSFLSPAASIPAYFAYSTFDVFAGYILAKNTCPPSNWLPILLTGEKVDHAKEQIFTSPQITATLALAVFALKIMEFVVFRRLMRLFRQSRIDPQIDNRPHSTATTATSGESGDQNSVSNSDMKAKAAVDSDDDLVVYDHERADGRIRDNSASDRPASGINRHRNSLPTVKHSKRVIA